MYTIYFEVCAICFVMPRNVHHPFFLAIIPLIERNLITVYITNVLGIWKAIFLLKMHCKEKPWRIFCNLELDLAARSFRSFKYLGFLVFRWLTSHKYLRYLKNCKILFSTSLLWSNYKIFWLRQKMCKILTEQTFNEQLIPFLFFIPISSVYLQRKIFCKNKVPWIRICSIIMKISVVWARFCSLKVYVSQKYKIS